MRDLAFSLMELIVVIAIVAGLAAIAMPAYLSYTQKAEYAKILGIVDDVMKKSQEFYNVNGYYPTAEDLGYAVSPAPAFLDPSSFTDLGLPSFVDEAYIYPWPSYPNCNPLQRFGFKIDGFELWYLWGKDLNSEAIIMKCSVDGAEIFKSLNNCVLNDRTITAVCPAAAGGPG